jgi:hypothetical protein
MVKMEMETTAQLKWSDFKDQFKEEYAIQTNDKLIIKGLSNLE